MSSDKYVPVANFTNFFKRELFMYSLGDIKFRKPVSLKKVAYTTIFLIIWIVPFYMIFGIVFSPFYFVLLLAPPILLANFASRPVWGGRGLLDFLKVLFKFIFSPKVWTDTKEANNLRNEETFTVEHTIWISRRRELQYLADLREERAMQAEGTGESLS